MKQFLILLFIGLGIGCSPTKNSSKETDLLNGTWIPVKQELGGSALPESVFKQQKLIILNNSYQFSAESIDKGELIFANGKMDIYGKDGVNAGKHFTALYKYEDNLLTVIYNLSGDSYPVSFDTKGKSSLFLSVYKKELVK